MSSSSFESFWQAYPKRVGKALALKKWESMKLDDSAPTIVAHLKQRVKDDKRWKDGFVLDPATFLNQRRWEDEYEKIVYRIPDAKPMREEAEVWPQPCQWQAAANRILFAVLQAEPMTPADRLPKLVQMKQQMGERLKVLYGSRIAPAAEWRKISEDAFYWLLGAARGISRKPGAEASGQGEGERRDVAA